MFPALLVRLKVDDPREFFFRKVRAFSGIVVYIDFVDFWETCGFRFVICLSILHMFRYFQHLDFCVDLLMEFS